MVLTGHNFVHQTASLNLDLANFADDFACIKHGLWDLYRSENLLDDCLAINFFSFGLVSNTDAMAQNVHANRANVFGYNVTAMPQERVSASGLQQED